MMDVGNVVRLFSRQQQGGGKDAGQELLDLLKNPYNDQVSLFWLFRTRTGY
jgi:hypothetical protein